MINALDLYAQIHIFNLYPIIDVLKHAYPDKKIEFAYENIFDEIKGFLQNSENKTKHEEFSTQLLVLKNNIIQADKNIELQKTDVGDLIRALDFYTRIVIGQLWEVTLVLRMFVFDVDSKKLEMMEDCVTRIAADVFSLSKYSSYGIYNKSVPNDSRIMYEIQQVLRHELWKIGDKKYHTVDAYPAHHQSGYPLIGIETRI